MYIFINSSQIWFRPFRSIYFTRNVRVQFLRNYFLRITSWNLERLYLFPIDRCRMYLHRDFIPTDISSSWCPLLLLFKVSKPCISKPCISQVIQGFICILVINGGILFYFLFIIIYYLYCNLFFYNSFFIILLNLLLSQMLQTKCNFLFNVLPYWNTTLKSKLQRDLMARILVVIS